MNKLEWAKAYHQHLKDTLIKMKYYRCQVEADVGLTLHEDLDGKGPAITYGGDFEILGTEIMMHTNIGTTFVSLPIFTNHDYFAEPENSECVRIYEI